MKKSTKKRLKKIFNLYNLAIAGCVILIIVSIIILVEPDFYKISLIKEKDIETTEEYNNNDTHETMDVIDTGTDSQEDISEDKAKKTAIKQFEKLDEKGLKKDDLEILKIQRDGKEYYYISSPQNTLEISVKGGEITRINSVKVEK